MMISVLALLGWMWMSPPCETGFCRCAPLPDVPSAVALAEAVFTGTVVAVHDTTTGTSDVWRAERAVTLRVDRTWKGAESETVVVLTELGGGRCGVHLELGESYLVYADGGPGALLRTGTCGRTAELSRAAADIRALGEPARRWR
jgi:hypothetical protein